MDAVLKKGKENVALSSEENLENEEAMEDFRIYWRYPRLANHLPQKKREELTRRFLDLVDKSREENAKQRSKIMKERNRLLPHVTEDVWRK